MAVKNTTSQQKRGDSLWCYLSLLPKIQNKLLTLQGKGRAPAYTPQTPSLFLLLCNLLCCILFLCTPGSLATSTFRCRNLSILLLSKLFSDSSSSGFSQALQICSTTIESRLLRMMCLWLQKWSHIKICREKPHCPLSDPVDYPKSILYPSDTIS